MHITGIICEFNPLHTGHQHLLQFARAQAGAEGAVVCLMSGNFVQRGAPAIFDKSLRAQAALACGADLVLEMPLPVSLSSAEGFAAGSVALLAPFCQSLCFGAEDADAARLLSLSQALLTPQFSAQLRTALARGLSFPAARTAALDAMGVDAAPLAKPNNTLAVEYGKAVLAQGFSTALLPLARDGDYHAETAGAGFPSATAVRACIEQANGWETLVPPQAAACFRSAPVHTLAAGERAMLARLRAMTDAEFAALPFGSEGLWRKFMRAARTEATLSAILTATKSKRYTRSRLDRMAMCAFLGLTSADLSAPAPYARVLALNTRGRAALRIARETARFPNAGEDTAHPYQAREALWQDLYGLFHTDAPDAPGQERRRRVFFAE